MAAVAGAISEFAGKGLLEYTSQVILENGGDIFIKTDKERKIGIYAGDSVLSGKVALRIIPEATPAGISTSSGTVGHSLSFGRADAVTVVSSDAALADACATAACNKVKTEADIKAALDFVSKTTNVIVKVNEIDLEHLEMMAGKKDSVLGQYSHIKFEVNNEIEPGGCVLCSEHGQIDGQLDTQIERIANELLMTDRKKNE